MLANDDNRRRERTIATGESERLRPCSVPALRTKIHCALTAADQQELIDTVDEIARQY